MAGFIAVTRYRLGSGDEDASAVEPAAHSPTATAKQRNAHPRERRRIAKPLCNEPTATTTSKLSGV
jgi:hypothetical protein